MKYVLITAARNEQDFIENTIFSVLDQTILPMKWIIISDRSTDKTNEIVEKYCKENSLIQLIKFDGTHYRNFASKVYAINFAYNSFKELDFEFIGILDADITLKPDYYADMNSKFAADDKLGIAGGGFYDVYDEIKEKIPYSDNNVRGAVQLFRRQCFEEIGGIFLLL